MKHGLSSHKNRHPLYQKWRHIKGRCYNPNNSSYHNYGGRGIKMCDSWKNNPLKFINWALKNGWEEGLVIDRINVDGNYSPQNCRFVNLQISSLNRRISKKNTSGYRGVCWHKRHKKWMAYINRKSLGYFDSPRLAALRYDVEAYLTEPERKRNFS